MIASDLPSRLTGKSIILLAGGVGGAKLADGLAQIVPADKLTIIVNTGDDFHHLGLTLCPDLDTVMYTLAGVANPETGWGRMEETWRTLDEVSRLGGPNWFRLGDLDLAIHLIRSHFLDEGKSLTEATRHLSRHFGVKVDLLPMADQPAATMIDSDAGLLSFQDWFVARRWQPAVNQVILPEDVRATPRVLAALERADLVLIAPSNPFVSIDPILNVYPIREMINDIPEMVVAVSPIVAGQALKGPAAKMMVELGLTPGSQAVLDYYGDLLDAFVYDCRDAVEPNLSDVAGLKTDTVMQTPADRRRLAQQILEFFMELVA
jgi:LPPG:FO 2-phospho-L-lactate transferase